MEELTTLELLVNKTVADEVKRKGLAELAMRRGDAKFKSMIKCSLANSSTAQKESAEKIVSTAMERVFKGNASDIKDVRVAVKNLGKNIGGLSAVTKNIASQVDSIYQYTSTIKSLSFLNTGLSLTNIAIDAAGFVVIIDRLNQLNYELQGVAIKLDQIKNIKKNEKIAQCQKLIMLFNSLAEKIGEKEDVDVDVIEKLLVEMKSFISEMIYNLQDETLGTELVLGIINAMLPAYTFLLKVFVEKKYYAKHKLPANYDIYLNLYDELEEANYRKKLESFYYEYYFAEEKMNIIDVLDLINAQILLGLNGKVQIEDQVALQEILGNEEKVKEFDRGLDRIVNGWVKEEIPSIAEESGVEEKVCAQVLGLQY